jgi:hypothetical protein
MDTQAARERCEAATPEPWLAVPSTSMKWDERGNVGIVADVQESARVIGEVFETVGHGVHAGAKANAEFVAHARSDLPAALEALEKEGKA